MAYESISIHVPRERDDECTAKCTLRYEISIHVPRERDDFRVRFSSLVPSAFQSTSLVRGTTGCTGIVKPMLSISIHVPRERDD